MDLRIIGIASALISAGGLLLYDSVGRAGVSEAEFQRRHLLAACLTRMMALWLGLVFLAVGIALLVMVALQYLPFS